MKNKAGREEEKCRVRRSVGDNQHQVRTAYFQVVNDMSLQVETLEVGQEIIDPVQDPPAEIIHLRPECLQVSREVSNHIHRQSEDGTQGGTGKRGKQQCDRSDHHELDKNQRQRLEEHPLDGNSLGIEHYQQSQRHDNRIDEQGDREA